MKYLIAGGFIATVTVVVLAACTPTTKTATYDAKAALLAADNIALAYLSQPPCIAAAAVTCVDPGVKTQIKTASARATVARKAVDAAVAIGQAGDAAGFQAAVVDFAAVVAPYAILVK